MEEQYNSDGGTVEQRSWKSGTIIVEEWNSDGGTVEQRWWNNDTEKWGTEMVEQ